ncbi:MAG: hypothetical protein R6U51_01970 [Anaerolineales bacterium]
MLPVIPERFSSLLPRSLERWIQRLLVGMVLVLIMAVSACRGLEADSNLSPSLKSWVDAPLDGAVLPLAPYRVVIHGTDPGGVSALELRVDDEVLYMLQNPEPDQLLVSLERIWRPASSGSYVIQARAQNADGVWSAPASATVKLLPETITPTPTFTLLPTLTAEATTTPLPTSTPCAPSVDVQVNANCRAGPHTGNMVLAYLTEGDRISVNGRNRNWTWWNVALPEDDLTCWVSDSVVETSCIPEDLAYLSSPPYIQRVTRSTDVFYWGDYYLREVTISAEIGGESRVTQAVIYYRLQGGGSWQNQAMDADSGGRWEGTIHAHDVPGYEDVISAPLEYFLEAWNEDGLRTRTLQLRDIQLGQGP